MSKHLNIKKPLGILTYGLLKKYPELFPLVLAIGGACVMGAVFTGYSLATKPDVRVSKFKESPPWEFIPPTKSTKLIGLCNEKPEAIPEREKIREEIGSYKY